MWFVLGSFGCSSNISSVYWTQRGSLAQCFPHSENILYFFQLIGGDFWLAVIMTLTVRPLSFIQSQSAWYTLKNHIHTSSQGAIKPLGWAVLFRQARKTHILSLCRDFLSFPVVYLGQEVKENPGIQTAKNKIKVVLTFPYLIQKWQNFFLH